MTSQPEKLFRDKLENFQRPAPAAAWERIESNLDKTSNKKLWLKIAAGLLLLTVAGFLLRPAQTSGPAETVSQTDKTKTVTPQKENVVENNQNNVQPVVADQAPIKKSDKPKTKTEVVNSIEPEQSVATVEKTEVLPENNFTVEPIENTPAIVVAEAKAEPSTTIVYTAEEVNARFMKKNVSSEATTQEKKPSGIQKLMGLAYDLKNNENGLRDLRQKKDEILALNFLNNEDKTEKRNN
jgi:hypothetical protein